MVRYAYICSQILQIYRAMDSIRFPIKPRQLISRIPNCRVMSFQKFAEINKCCLNDVIQICESKTGCTHYDTAKDRYLILLNESSSDNNVPGRKIWTEGHEYGHVQLGHLPIAAVPQLAENGFNNLSAAEFEAEADYFASMLLCPMPICQLLDIRSPQDIHEIFGLSYEASENRYNAYQKWVRSHRKTAWENDMKKLYITHR